MDKMSLALTEMASTSLSLVWWTTQTLQKKNKAFFAPSTTPSPCTVRGLGAATTVGTTLGATSGDLNGVTIQVRSSEYDKKDLSAKIERQLEANHDPIVLPSQPPNISLSVIRLVQRKKIKSTILEDYQAQFGTG